MDALMDINNTLYKSSLEKLFEYLPDKDSVFLITGASGLIGSVFIDLIHLSNIKLGRHHVVYALGRSFEKLKKRFPFYGKDVLFIEQNICEPITVDIIPNYIIHLASNADPRSYAKYPVETLITNVEGTKNVLKLAKDIGARILLTSTFEVYGKKEGNGFFSEDDYGVVNINAIRSCYPESKRTAELLLKCSVDEYKVDAVIARLCSIYGPTMLKSDSKAHAQFIRNALKHENIVLKSEGSQKRTYMYVMDTVSALLTILQRGKSGEAYNVSNENSITTIKDLAMTIANLSGTSIVYEIPDKTEQKGFSQSQNCILVNQKLRNLGWKGRYSLREGLMETLSILGMKADAHSITK